MQSDPLSPERGQLAFVQDLLRRVTYETMSRRERKARHLAAAAFLRAEPAGDEELAGIVASHYLDAFRAGEQEPDAAELRRAARSMLVRAGERAASLAAGAEAAAYLGRAVELSDDPLERAELLERVGAAALQAGNSDQAGDRFGEAAGLLEEVGQHRSAARASARMATAWRVSGRAADALSVLRAAYETLAAGPQDADLAIVAAEFARLAFFVGEYGAVVEPIELALDLAESLNLPEVLAEALNTKGVILFRRATEAEALIRQSVRVALAHDLPPTALRAQFNLAGLFMEWDRYGEATGLLHEALELARRRGYRDWETQMLMQLADNLSSVGLWDEARGLIDQVPRGVLREPLAAASALVVASRTALGRGSYDELAGLLEDLADLRTAGDRQDEGAYYEAHAVVARARGRHGDAVESGRRAFEISRSLYQLHYATDGFVTAAEALLDAGDAAAAGAFIDEVDGRPPIEHRPLLDGQIERLRARLSAARGSGDPSPRLRAAADLFRAIDARFWLAVTLCQHGEWLCAEGRAAEARPLLRESRELFGALGAAPWLERLAAVGEDVEVPATG